MAQAARGRLPRLRPRRRRRRRRACPPPDEGAEVPELRTASSNTFALGEGTYRAEVYTEPVNYLDDEGDYEPIDNTLVATDRPGYAYVNAANSYRAYFPERLESDPVVVEADGESVSFALEGASGAPTASGSELTYEDAQPGVDLSYRIGPEGVEELIELESPEAAQPFSFELETSPGLEASEEGSAVTFTESGQEVLSFAPPLVYDAAGAAEPLELELSEQGGELSAELSADPQWLESPAREYPVTVDPTVVTRVGMTNQIDPGRDCWIGPGISVSRCSEKLKVGGMDTTRRRSLLRFPVTAAISPESTIQSANLEMTLAANPPSSPPAIAAHQITLGSGQSWNADVTWENRTAAATWTNSGGDIAATSAAATTPSSTQVSWDVRSLVQSWVNLSQENNGLLLKGTSNTDSRVLEFHSDEDGSLQRPALNVTFQSPLGLTVTPRESHAADLSWTNPPGTTEVQISRREFAAGTPPAQLPLIDKLTTAPPSSYRDYLLWRNTPYEYRVVATTSAGTVQETKRVTTGQVSAGKIPRLYDAQSFWYDALPDDAAVADNSSALINSSILQQLCGRKMDPNANDNSVPSTCSGSTAKPANFDASAQYGMSLAYANPASTQYTVDCTACGSSADPTFRIPAYANGAANLGDDQKLAVIDPTTNQELGLDSTATYAPNWSAQYAYVFNTQTGTQWDGLRCNGFAGQVCGGPTATGFSNMGGIVRPEEIKDGIDHALVLMTPFTHRFDMACPGTNTNVLGYEFGNRFDAIPFGVHVRLRHNWNSGTIPSGWPEAVRQVAKALRDYGAYIHDTSGTVTIQGENRLGRGYNPWRESGKLRDDTGNQDDIPLLSSNLTPPFPWGDLRVLKYQLNEDGADDECVDP